MFQGIQLTVRNNVDPVPVVVERDFVQQTRINDLRVVHDGTIRRVPKRVANARDVVAAPHRGTETLRNLLSDEVPEDGVLAVEFVVNANDLFAHIGWSDGSPLELRSVGRSRENP